MLIGGISALPHPHFTHNIRRYIRSISPHFTTSKIRTSAFTLSVHLDLYRMIALLWLYQNSKRNKNKRDESATTYIDKTHHKLHQRSPLTLLLTNFSTRNTTSSSGRGRQHTTHNTKHNSDFWTQEIEIFLWQQTIVLLLQNVANRQNVTMLRSNIILCYISCFIIYSNYFDTQKPARVKTITYV